MSKRGPKQGTVYQRRLWIPERLRVETDRQLVAAQHFSDRLDRLMSEIDAHGYPAGQIDTRAVQRLVQALEAVQGAVIAGIENYLVRPGAGSASATPSPPLSEPPLDAR